MKENISEHKNVKMQDADDYAPKGEGFTHTALSFIFRGENFLYYGDHNNKFKRGTLK